MIEAPQPQGEQPSQYLPAGPPDPLLFEAFEGINTATTRPGVDDKQAYWLDGFMPLGPRRNLRTMYGVSPAIFTTTTNNIAVFNFGNIGPTAYIIVIFRTGDIWAVNTTTGGAAQIAGPGTILNPSNISVDITQWGSQFIQIVSNQLDGYFIWDGVTLYGAGATVPGYGVIPTAIGGTAIQNYAGRVWVANGPVIFFTAPGSLTDFSSANGGGNFISTDGFLRVGFTSLKQTNGFLYLIADSSINYISGVQTSGDPPITTFTNQNADPESGTPWPATVDVFSRNIVFANAFGAHVSYGGAVAKISEPLDGVYNSANFAGIIPSSAKAIIFGKKCWVLLLPVVDPVGGQIVNKLFLWNGQKIWWASQQDVNLVYIQGLEINSVLTAWGTDGTSIYQLFFQPSNQFTKIAQTKLWDNPGGYQFTKFVNRLWAIMQFYGSNTSAVSVTIDTENGLDTSSAIALSFQSQLATWLDAAGGAATWLNSSGAVASWITSNGAFAVAQPVAIGSNGVLTGFTVFTSTPDMSIVSMSIQNDVGAYRG